MAINRFLLFDEVGANLQDDATYATDSQRLNGLTPGQARTIMHNKLFKQVSTMVQALGELVKDTGFTIYDSSPTLINDLKESLQSAKYTTTSELVQDNYNSDTALTVEDVLLKNASTYRALPNLEENVAYLLAREEIAGNVQTYSNFFYDMFYSGHSAKIGYLDNRYLSYTGSLSAGATTLVGANIDYSNFPVTAPYINTNYKAFTIDDGTNREIVYIKNIDVFSSASYAGTYPATVNIATTGTYYFDMKGGKGGGKGTANGGDGGTLKFKTNCTAGDVIVVEKVSGGGKGVKVKKNGTTIAVVGGGGDAGIGIEFNPTRYTYWPGGAGGGNQGGNGTTNFGHLVYGGGAIGATGGSGGSCGVYTATGKNAPDGSGGIATGRDGNNVCSQNGDANGGGGYAGGGGGYHNWSSTLSLVGCGSAGGASSYLDAGITAIENSNGTNSSSESILITLESVALKNPLMYNYTNPILYRGNLSIDTGNHRASVKAIKGIYVDALQLRVLVKNTQETFWDIASWIETTSDFVGVGATVAFGATQNVDESVYEQMVQTQYVAGSNKQIRVEATSVIPVNYAVVTFKLTKVDDAAYIYKMLGVVN